MRNTLILFFIFLFSYAKAETLLVTINASSNSCCAGTTITFTAAVENGGTSPVYTWKVNNITQGTNSPSLSYVPSNNDQIKCIVLSNLPGVENNPDTSNVVIMVVNSVTPVSVSIVASANNVCAGTSVTFTATPTNGGTSPAYQWQVNNINVGSNLNTYSYTPLNGDKVNCLLTSSVTCPSVNPAKSDTITMVITSSPTASVIITPSANSVCSGTLVNFTAIATNGGTFPSYMWWVNNIAQVGATNSTFSYTPTGYIDVKCTMTSSLLCILGNPATYTKTITVNQPVPVSIIISANSNDTICQNTLVTYTSTIANGGTSPQYQWKKAGVNISGATTSSYSYIPTNSDAITCVLTSNQSCTYGSPATSNSVFHTITPNNTMVVTTWTSNYAVMPSTSVIYHVATIYGGTSPSYQWKVNDVNVSGETNSSYTYTPVNNDNVSCNVLSNYTGCLSSNPTTSNVINMVVYSTGTSCAGTPTVIYGGRTYNTVQIGTQCWLRENMNIGNTIIATTEQTNNNIIEKYCYNNDTNNCNVYGGMYQWAEAVQYYNGVTNTTHWNIPYPTVVQGICPSGWHIPLYTEAQTMFTYLGGTTLAGGAIKETGTVHWGIRGYPFNVGATNSSGFTALASGSSLTNDFKYGPEVGCNSTYDRQYMTAWTVSRGDQTTSAYMFGATFAFADAISGQSTKAIANAIRCIKN